MTARRTAPQRKFPGQRLFGLRPVHDLSGCLGTLLAIQVQHRYGEHPDC